MYSVQARSQVSTMDRLRRLRKRKLPLSTCTDIGSWKNYFPSSKHIFTEQNSYVPNRHVWKHYQPNFNDQEQRDLHPRPQDNDQEQRGQLHPRPQDNDHDQPGELHPRPQENDRPQLHQELGQEQQQIEEIENEVDRQALPEPEQEQLDEQRRDPDVSFAILKCPVG